MAVSQAAGALCLITPPEPESRQPRGGPDRSGAGLYAIFMHVARVTFQFASIRQDGGLKRPKNGHGKGTHTMHSLGIFMLRPIVLGLTLALALPTVCLAAEEQPSFSPKSFLSDRDEQDLLKQVPAAKPEDVASPDAIVRAMHDAVSGPRGQWDDRRLRSLFIPDALIEYTDEDGKNPPRLRTITVDELVRILKDLHQKVAWYEKAGALHVTELHRKGEGPVLAVVPHTGNEGTRPVTEPEASRPSTSVTQLVKLQGRWWITSHAW